MNTNFDIVCNHCGRNLTVPPFQEYVVCTSCQTYLKVEESETTVTTIVIDEQEFLTVSKIPISTQNQDLQRYKEELATLEKEWLQKEEAFKGKKKKTGWLSKIQSKITQTISLKTQSLLWILFGVAIIIYGLFFSENSQNNQGSGFLVFYIVFGGQILVGNGKEYLKIIRHEQATQDYLDEKERLEMLIFMTVNN